jgi:hypothetical protein
MQTQRYDECMARYQEAGLHQATSLSALNFGQSVIFTFSMTAAMVMVAQVGVGTVWCGLSGVWSEVWGGGRFVVVVGKSALMDELPHTFHSYLCPGGGQG